jgi:hypothetical protein
MRFFTPGPIHRISSRDGCYLAMGCRPLNITNIYFILREWVHHSPVQRPWAGRYGSGVSRKSIVGTPASMHGSRAVGVACLESMNWVRVTGLFESYWRLRAWSCDLIGRLASAWSPRWNHSGCLQGQQQLSQRSAVEGAVCTGCQIIIIVNI